MSDQPREQDRTTADGTGSDPQVTDDQPTVNLKRDGVDEQVTALPTSDPVFPTASPQLRPPRPADVSGFGSPGGAAPGRVPGQPAGAQAPGAGLDQRRPPAPRPPRTAAEIRADIEASRQELSQSVEVLRDRVDELTDWRGQIRKHRRELTIAAAAVGFVVGARFMMKRRRG